MTTDFFQELDDIARVKGVKLVDAFKAENLDVATYYRWKNKEVRPLLENYMKVKARLESM